LNTDQFIPYADKPLERKKGFVRGMGTVSAPKKKAPKVPSSDPSCLSVFPSVPLSLKGELFR
jgi:hypothetical protein